MIAERGGGPPTPIWLCLVLSPLIPLLMLVAWIPFTMPVMLPVGFVWDHLFGELNPDV